MIISELKAQAQATDNLHISLASIEALVHSDCLDASEKDRLLTAILYIRNKLVDSSAPPPSPPRG
jgi:hypothetical protein